MASERTQAANGSVNVNYNPDITQVETTDVSALDEDVARITFSFPITYSLDDEEIGSITIDGELLWKDQVEEVMDAWEDDESLPQDVNIAVLNHLYRKCLPEAVAIANRLDLPSPVPVPRARKKQG